MAREYEERYYRLPKRKEPDTVSKKASETLGSDIDNAQEICTKLQAFKYMSAYDISDRLTYPKVPPQAISGGTSNQCIMKDTKRRRSKMYKRKLLTLTDVAVARYRQENVGREDHHQSVSIKHTKKNFGNSKVVNRRPGFDEPLTARQKFHKKTHKNYPEERPVSPLLTPYTALLRLQQVVIRHQYIPITQIQSNIRAYHFGPGRMWVASHRGLNGELVDGHDDPIYGRMIEVSDSCPGSPQLLQSSPIRSFDMPVCNTIPYLQLSDLSRASTCIPDSQLSTSSDAVPSETLVIESSHHNKSNSKTLDIANDDKIKDVDKPYKEPLFQLSSISDKHEQITSENDNHISSTSPIAARSAYQKIGQDKRKTRGLCDRGPLSTFVHKHISEAICNDPESKFWTRILLSEPVSIREMFLWLKTRDECFSTLRAQEVRLWCQTSGIVIGQILSDD